jgi:hypothetical protein
MLIPNKFNGYSRDGRREYHFGGGGGGGSGSGTQTQVVDLPDWAKPTAQRQLGLAESVTDINQNPFQSFGGIQDASGQQVGFDPSKVVAGQDPLQQQAYQGAGSMQTSPQLGMASGLMAAASQRALNTGYRPGQFQNQYYGFDPYQSGEFQNQFQAPGQYQSGQFGADRVQAQNLQNFQMGPAERVQTQSFAQPGAADAYMSPYMQSVVGIQQREAQRQADIAGTQRGAQAVASGAFGGSRQAIMDAEAARNLAMQKGDIQATGQQAAFQNAQQQFNAEQQARLQAQQANQGAGLTVGQQNLAANLGIQQLGAGQSMQAQLANQQQNLETQRLAEQSRQFGAGQGLTAAQLQAQYGMSAQQAEEASRQFASNQAAQQAAQGAQYGQAAQQLAEQSRQFGGSLGLQGLQAAMTGAGQLGALGQQQFGQQKDILGLQSQFGGQQQAQQQALIDAEAQNFAAQQRYPYQQLEFMSNILRGTPMGTVSSLYQPQPSAASQLIGAGTALYGASKLAKGGVVKNKSAGLAELALSKI